MQEDLILAILITGLVMLIFLHTIRSTFIVLLAIPTSIIATFLVMWAFGFTLNTMTLLALTLVIGILVDDSIVVLENTERHLKMGKRPKQAALDGRSEIGLAAITITLVDVVVYLPVAFVSGIIGQFFRSYGLTIVAATLFSLLDFLHPDAHAGLAVAEGRGRPARAAAAGSAQVLPYRRLADQLALERLYPCLGSGIRRPCQRLWRDHPLRAQERLYPGVGDPRRGRGPWRPASTWSVAAWSARNSCRRKTTASSRSTSPCRRAPTWPATDAATRQVEQIIRANVPEAP